MWESKRLGLLFFSVSLTWEIMKLYFDYHWKVGRVFWHDHCFLYVEQSVLPVLECCPHRRCQSPSLVPGMLWAWATLRTVAPTRSQHSPGTCNSMETRRLCVAHLSQLQRAPGEGRLYIHVVSMNSLEVNLKNLIFYLLKLSVFEWLGVLCRKEGQNHSKGAGGKEGFSDSLVMCLRLLFQWEKPGDSGFHCPLLLCVARNSLKNNSINPLPKNSSGDNFHFTFPPFVGISIIFIYLNLLTLSYTNPYFINSQILKLSGKGWWISPMMLLRPTHI